jgi:RNA polymerase sigma-70 factor (ECF subfamily)
MSEPPRRRQDARDGAEARPAIDWAAALAEHGRWLRLVVLARLGERQAVEEVVQEVALAAVAQRSPLADPGKLPSWLYRLAVRQALLYRRRAGRHRRLRERYGRRLGDPEAPASAAEADPLDWLIRDERRRLVREALDRLAPRDAEILLLKYAEGWSVRELAARLGVGPAAVEARLHRARGRLRAELSASEVVETVPPCK